MNSRSIPPTRACPHEFFDYSYKTSISDGSTRCAKRVETDAEPCSTRSSMLPNVCVRKMQHPSAEPICFDRTSISRCAVDFGKDIMTNRSEEQTSELQSHSFI